MDMTVNWYLIWEEKTDRNFRYRKFVTREYLNDYLMVLDKRNLKSYKIISGFMLKEEVLDGS